MSPVTTRPATAELASAARPNRFALWGDLLIFSPYFLRNAAANRNSMVIYLLWDPKHLELHHLTN